MSAIIDRIEIPLTPEQHQMIRAFWKKHQKTGAAMLAVQPLGASYRPSFREGKPYLRCAVLDRYLADEIQIVLKKHREQRP